MSSSYLGKYQHKLEKNLGQGGRIMTSRQTGRRMGTVAEQHGKKGVRQGSLQTSSGKKTEMPRSGEHRQLIRLMICGVVFVALVAVKLLLPAKMIQFNEKLSNAMEQNLDVQAVFSAVGRAFSDKDSSMRDTVQKVYQEVFGADTDEAEEVVATALPVAELPSAIELLQESSPESVAPELPTAEPQAQQESVQEEVATLAYVLYSEQNLPENVSLEQAMLAFDYCTPVNGVLTSEFGYREHPIEGEERFHYGIDLAAETGTDIVCFADGTVTAIGESSSYGKYCIVSHTGGYTTLYAHCNRITVTSGATVKTGEKIAEVGETGMATGSHLHFELQHNHTYFNPIYYVSTT